MGMDRGRIGREDAESEEGRTEGRGGGGTEGRGGG